MDQPEGLEVDPNVYYLVEINKTTDLSPEADGWCAPKGRIDCLYLARVVEGQYRLWGLHHSRVRIVEVRPDGRHHRER